MLLLLLSRRLVRAVSLGVVVWGVVLAWSSGASAVPITNGLVAGYEFTGNADDVSGNGNDGVVNGATLTTDRFGNANSAYSFDGVDDIVEIGAVLTNPSSMTIASWIRRADNAVRPWQDIVAGTCGTPLFGLASFHDARLSFGGQCDNPMAMTFDTAVIEDNLWHSVVATYDGDTVRLYRDGSLVNSSSHSGDFATGLALGIGGAASHSEPESFAGDIDDVYIYDRALSSAEVQTLYSAVPEPNTALLLGIGMMGLGMRRRRRGL